MTTSTSYALTYNATTHPTLTQGYYWTPGNYASGATADCTHNTETMAVAVFGTDDNGVTTTAIVKSKAANALGLYDMSGNLYEWCFDLYNNSNLRVIRSRDFTSNIGSMQVGYYDWTDPNYFYFPFGFRFARNK